MRKLLLLLLLAIFVFPVLFLFLKSITFSWRYPDVLPTAFSMRAWEALASEPQLLPAVGMTLFIGAVVVVLNLLLGIPAALALSWVDFRGKVAVETIFFLPILVPVLAIAMGLHITMIRLGIADHPAGVILIHLLPTLPYTIRVLRGGFDRLDPAWMQLGETLGAGVFRRIATIAVPIMAPSLRSAAVLTFVISLSQYVLTAIIGGGRVTTLPLLYYPFFNSADQAVIAAFSVLFAVLPLLFLFVWETVSSAAGRLLRP
ncbi:ABC transporter permease [Alkalicoccus urumqiensis]|uniref:ABC transporter permease n=1 Tax=Alkalicoccus urumqiensis TaxID=1548213 RepID=A0A2P6MK32_ALKUR|nr:ABC transporter permease subunit [Alkalicoccus urumqiensis]PRO66618.1 ABC transporter permease [Alkalicoccus urumqiensis]